MLGSGRSADDRRRRLLTEENIAGAAKAGGDESDDAESSRPTRTVAKSSNRYGAAGRAEKQTRITDLMPQTYGMLALALFVGLSFIAGLEAGYFYLPQLTPHSASGRIDALDLTAEGSLASWLSTTMLSLAAGAAWVVYSVRKHRADDYHGRYRVWLTAGMAWLLLGVDESASLHETFRDIMVGTTGHHGFGDGSIWWIGAYGLVLTVVGIRLMLDMKECRTSTTALGLTAVCYLTAVLVVLNGERHWLPQAILPATLNVMLKEGLELVGNLLLLTAMLVHARYVILEAQGEITPRAAKPKKEKPKVVKSATAAKDEPTKKELAKSELKSEAKPAGEAAQPKRSLFGWFGKAKVDPPHKTPAAPTIRKTSDLDPPRTEKVAAATIRPRDEATAEANQKFKKLPADFSDDDEDDSDHDRGHRKLSKADRKAMRRQKDADRRGYDD